MITFNPNELIQSADINANFAELKTKTDWLTEDTGWTEVTYQNSCVAYDSSAWYGWYYRKDETGTVFLRGLGKSGTTTSGTVLFNLPAGFRPNPKLLMLAQCSPNATSVRIDTETNGNVISTGTPLSNSWLSLNGLSFKAEQ